MYRLLSRPLVKIATWRYWFRLSRDVYDGNRSFASYTKTNTVESDVNDVYWLDLMVVNIQQDRKYLNTVQDQNSSFSFNNDYSNRRNIEQWMINND